MSVIFLKSMISFFKRETLLWSFSPELVLKVRIQNPNARENDFIEVELDRQELTYRSLLRVCCRELDVSAEHVEKIRKLPNTMLRKVWESWPALYIEYLVYCMLQQLPHKRTHVLKNVLYIFYE